jgi:DNA-binding transcriptional MerR regulator
MLIGELSKRTGFSHDTIRFYEKKGLITLDKKTRRDNNYKEYPETVLEQLLLIKTVKALGFTLKEADEFMSGWSVELASCETLSSHLSEKIDRVNKQLELLNEIKLKLTRSLQQCNAGNCEFEKMVPSCIC